MDNRERAGGRAAQRRQRHVAPAVNAGGRGSDSRDTAGPWSWLWSAGLAQRLAVAFAGIGLAWLVILLTIAAD